MRAWFGDLLESIGAASGAALESETGAVFEYEDGLCVRINSFMSHEQAHRVAEAIVSRSGAKASSDADA